MFWRNIGNKKKQEGDSLKKTKGGIFKKIKIGALWKTLIKLGIDIEEFECKNGNIYWMTILSGFKIYKNEAGNEAILLINGLRFLVLNYTAPYWRTDGELKTSIILAPISPAEPEQRLSFFGRNA